MSWNCDRNTPSHICLELDALETNIGTGVISTTVVSEWNLGANFPITDAFYHISLDPTVVGVEGTLIDPTEGQVIDVYLVGWASNAATGAPNTNGQMSGIHWQVTRTNGELVMLPNVERRISAGFTTADVSTTTYSDLPAIAGFAYDPDVFINGGGFKITASAQNERYSLQLDGKYSNGTDTLTVKEAIGLGYMPCPSPEDRIAELERCKLPKTCYQVCELVEGPNAGQYRRSANFGGGQNVQNQGMGAFTGTHPSWNTQPWLGNAQGAITNSAGGAHFYDRSAGGNARERLSHETYIYIPAAHVQAVSQLRFRALGQQFAQVRISPAGGDLNASTVVGQVNYLNAPVNRFIGNPVPVVQDSIYGVLAYVLDRQDNADVEIQYLNGAGAWVDLPHSWMYPNLVDAQAAESLDILWCVQGEIATNEVDGRRITEEAVKVLGVSSVEVPCDDPVADVQEQVTALQDKLNDQVRLVYRLTPETADQMTVRRWLQPPDSVAHNNVVDIWTGPIDPVTNHPSHPNPPTSVAADDWNYSGADDQMEGFGFIEVLTPIWIRDNNGNTGERGLVRFQECCGDWQTLQETNTDTPSTDRGVLDPVLLPSGIHFLWVGTSDVTANQGFDLEWSATETGTYANFSGYEGRKWTEKPRVECLEIGFCDDTPEGYDEKPPEICDPVFVPSEASGLSQQEVEALITPHPDQEVCTGDFVDVSGRTGWLHTWSPTYTASSGTIVEDWVQVSTAEVAPNCDTDITVNGSLGNSYMQLRNMNGRVWYDVRLLINGAAVNTYTFQNYHYEDDIGNTNLDDDISPMGSFHFARNTVPAGATITVEMARRHNFVAGNAAIASPFGRVISGLRSHFNVHYSPVEIVTGRV